ncbi:hypothetical protein [Marinobacterium stanieri]|uniref:hypothetical protein n=1 Tax=Marinobacterium stanieri TaxID=49186 RepID=UPI003A951E46
MRKLVVEISEVMSVAAQREGIAVSVESLHPGVNRFLQDIEHLLSAKVVESFSALQWAVLISHANKYHLDPHDVLIGLVTEGMNSAVKVTSDLYQRSKADEGSIERSTERPKLVLVKG